MLVDLISRPSRRLILWQLLAGTTSLLAACQAAPATPTAPPSKPVTDQATRPSTKPESPTAAPKPVAPTTVPKPAAPVAFKFGVISGQFATIFEMIGQDKGLYKEEGVELNLIPVDANPTLEKGLLAGEFDAIDVTPTGPLAATAQGGKYKLVGSPKPGLPFVLLAKKEITGIKDLVGKSFAISGPGDLSQSLMFAVLEKEGIEPDKIDWVVIGGLPAMFQSVMAGKADATMMVVDFIPASESNPNVRVVLDFAEALPNYIRVATITSEQVIKDKPDALQRFLIGYARSIRYAIEHKDESVALAAKLTGGDPKLMAWIFDRYISKRMVGPDLTLKPESVDYLQQLNIQAKRQERALPLDQVLDLSFQKKVVEKLGAYRWR